MMQLPPLAKGFIDSVKKPHGSQGDSVQSLPSQPKSVTSSSLLPEMAITLSAGQRPQNIAPMRSVINFKDMQVQKDELDRLEDEFARSRFMPNDQLAIRSKDGWNKRMQDVIIRIGNLEDVYHVESSSSDSDENLTEEELEEKRQILLKKFWERRETDKKIQEDPSMRKLQREKAFIEKQINVRFGKPEVRARFKRAVRLIGNALHFLKMSLPKEHRRRGSFLIAAGLRGREVMQFGISQTEYKVPSLNLGINCSQLQKRAIGLDPDERTEVDLSEMQDVINRLPCFEMYPKSIRQQLPRILFYDMFENERIILKKGHPPNFVYFILSGAIRILDDQENEKTGEIEEQLIEELGPFQNFGINDFMMGKGRMFTVLCKGHTDLLRVQKDDFMKYLYDFHKQVYDRLKTELMALPFLASMSEEDMITYAALSSIVTYSPDKVIIGSISELPMYVYFVIRGECKIVRQLTLYVKATHSKYGMKLPIPKYSLSEAGTMRGEEGYLYDTREKEIHHLSTATLTKGFYFGVGEDLSESFVVAKCRMQCLLIPRRELLKRGMGPIIEVLREDLADRLPDGPAALEKYIQEMEWYRYRQSILSEKARTTKVPVATKYSDVPASIRYSQFGLFKHANLEAVPENEVNPPPPLGPMLKFQIRKKQDAARRGTHAAGAPVNPPQPQTTEDRRESNLSFMLPEGLSSRVSSFRSRYNRQSNLSSLNDRESKGIVMFRSPRRSTISTFRRSFEYHQSMDLISESGCFRKSFEHRQSSDLS